jgi:DNA-binding NarL/FixJ family response regulator
MSEEERKLIDKLYYRKGLGVPRILRLKCFSHLSEYKLYKYLNSKEGKEIKVYKSERAEQVLKLKKKGIKYKKIAEITNLSLKTVYNYARLDL